MVGVLRSFDLPFDLYADDVQSIVGDAVERFGEREWKAVLLTNEIHGHLGIYSTIGAKMGLRACELLGDPGPDSQVSIISHAGSRPPVSCLNDGLQTSTGATVGHGLFQVADTAVPYPEATFICKDKSLTLRLKEEYRSQIESDIRTGVERFGHSPAYWAYVRSLAIRYWSGWDRREIFYSPVSSA